MHCREYFSAMNKASRQKAILEILRKEAIASQEDLQLALEKKGFEVGQATLSRDIREMGLVKSADGYAVPQGPAATEPALPSMARLVREFVQDIRLAQNLLVIKTIVGSAQPVAAALDSEQWPEVVGTLAGDDTILVISSNKKTAAGLAAKIRGLLH
jgi:transcriptional regulator of arginine metabolism